MAGRVLASVILTTLTIIAVGLFSHSPHAQEIANGRYQIVFRPELARDTWLLDTATGQVWRPVRYTDILGDPVVWKLMERIDSNEDLLNWLRTQEPKNP